LTAREEAEEGPGKKVALWSALGPDDAEEGRKPVILSKHRKAREKKTIYPRETLHKTHDPEEMNGVRR